MIELKRQRIKSIVEQSTTQQRRLPWQIILLAATAVVLGVSLSVAAV
jgi:hypothetical protein